MAAHKNNCYNPNGRPHKPIDWEEFEKLCEMQCTQGEIASFFGVHPNTISDNVKQIYKEDYSTVYKKYSDGGKCSLRRTQFKLAQKNTAMAIWLGKQYLDQKEHQPAPMVTEEILNGYQQMIDQLKGIQASRPSSPPPT